MRIYQRHEWGARHPDGFQDRSLPCSEAWLHHTVMGAPTTAAGERAEMRRIESVGQSRFGGGISYTFVVFPSGRVYEGHSVWRQGSHTGGRNDIASGIALAGNYEDRPMTDAQVNAIASLLRHGNSKGWFDQPHLDGGHRDLKATACPGRQAHERIPQINALAASAPSGGGSSSNDEEFDMRLAPGKNRVEYVPAVGRNPYFYLHTGYGNKVYVHEVTFVGRTVKKDGKTEARYLGQWKNRVWHPDRPGPWGIPKDTVFVSVRYTSDGTATAIVG